MEETIGKRIAQHRKRMKLTQDQLAEQLGVTAQAVSKWENDQSCPDITMLPKLASIFGITTDELLGAKSNAQVHVGEVVDPKEAEGGDSHEANEFHFQYSGGRRSALIFALFVLGVGAQMLAAALLKIDLGFWTILWPTALFFFGVYGLSKKLSFLSIGSILFSGYVLLNEWKLLPFKLGDETIIPIVIVLLGLGLLLDAFKKSKKPKFTVTSKDKNGKSKTNFTADTDRFDYSASFGEDHRVVSLAKLNSGCIDVSFGDYTIDLSGVESIGAECTLDANCSFGELTILVPKRYAVHMCESTAFAATSVNGQPDAEVNGTIRLEAHANFGEIQIRYI